MAERSAEPAIPDTNEGEPRTRSLPYESTTRVRHREMLGRVSDGGTHWGPQDLQREAAALCAPHFPERRGCPPGVVTVYEDGVLEVFHETDATIRMEYEASTSERAARRQLQTLVRGSLLTVDGLDVTWMQGGWSGPHRELVRRVQRSATDAPRSAAPYECTIPARVSPTPGVVNHWGASARSETSFADACLRAARELCDTPRCHVSVGSIDALRGSEDQGRDISLIDEVDAPATPTDTEPTVSAAADHEIAIRTAPPIRRRRRGSDAGLRWFPQNHSPRPGHHECRLTFLSRWGARTRPIEAVASSTRSHMAACRTAAGVLDESPEFATVEGPLVIDGLRPPQPERPWKGTPEVIADRLRASTVDGGASRSNCTVHAYAWSVTATRTIRAADVPDDFAGRLEHEPDPERARLGAFCLEGLEDAPANQTLAFASGSGDTVTCATGERQARTAHAVSPTARGEACALAVEQLCESENCLLELGGIDGVRVDRSMSFQRLAQMGPPRNIILDPF